jgi:hypothetical protein
MFRSSATGRRRERIFPEPPGPRQAPDRETSAVVAAGNESGLVRKHRRLYPVAETELGEDPGDVGLDPTVHHPGNRQTILSMTKTTHSGASAHQI